MTLFGPPPPLRLICGSRLGRTRDDNGLHFRSSLSGRLTGSRSLGRIRLTAGTQLTLPFVGGVTVQQPSHPFLLFLLLKILEILGFAANPGNESSPLDPSAFCRPAAPFLLIIITRGADPATCSGKGSRSGRLLLVLLLGTSWAELESSLGEVDKHDALQAPCTRLVASTTGPPEERALLETKRRRLAMIKCSPSTTSESNGRGMTNVRSRVAPHDRYIVWSQENLVIPLLLGYLR